MPVDASPALVTNDAVVFGLLAVTLALIFKTEQMPRFKKFYRIIPALALCYFVPSLFNTFGIVSPGASHVYWVASRFLLPASLVLLTLSIDIKQIIALGPKALVMFFTATVGIILGGPIAVLLVAAVSPETVGGVGPEAVWRGLSTVAGSWIGGGANQVAMKEVFGPSDELFSVMIAVDIVVAKLSMLILFFGAARSDAIDRWFKADNSAIKTLRDEVAQFQERIARIPTVTDLMIVIGVGFGVVGVSHLIADVIAPWFGTNYPSLAQFSVDNSFFWLVLIATTGGLLLSFTPLKNLEGAGASKIGTVCLYLLVATIGMSMDVTAVVRSPGVFIVGLIWLSFHYVLLLVVGKLIRAPFFFIAVGSQANVGGAASAPVIAAAFHPALAPVGVVLAVLGYAVGTFCLNLRRYAPVGHPQRAASTLAVPSVASLASSGSYDVSLRRSVRRSG